MRLENDWFDVFNWSSLIAHRSRLEALRGKTLTDICKVTIFISPEDKAKQLEDFTRESKLPLTNLISREPGILLLTFEDVTLGLIEERVRAALHVHFEVNRKLLKEMIEAEIISSDLRFCASAEPQYIEPRHHQFIGKKIQACSILRLKSPFERLERLERYGGLEFYFEDDTGFAYGPWIYDAPEGDPYPDDSCIMFLNEVDESKIEERMDL